MPSFDLDDPNSGPIAWAEHQRRQDVKSEALVEPCEQCGLPVETCVSVSKMKRSTLEQIARNVLLAELVHESKIDDLLQELISKRAIVSRVESVLAGWEDRAKGLREQANAEGGMDATYTDGNADELENVVTLLRAALGGVT